MALYHSKRLASPGQRIVLYGKERGCSAPGCDVKGYFCEVHHVIPYAQSPTTDVNQLTFACGGHHPLADKGWSTAKTPTATPNGHPHHISTAANPAPTPCTIPKNSSTQTKTTRRSSFVDLGGSAIRQERRNRLASADTLRCIQSCCSPT
ncbi:hypothetical protein I546_3180 [Mycobacterium kansasii 732]|nr:hypothetical protein I546_3180 [Mycobacterium kansasii 732]